MIEEIPNRRACFTAKPWVYGRDLIAVIIPSKVVKLLNISALSVVNIMVERTELDSSKLRRG